MAGGMAPTSMATQSAPPEAALTGGMAFTYSVSSADDGKWQAIICAANLGTFTATGVTVNTIWPEGYAPLIIRVLYGAIDMDAKHVSVQLGNMPAGAQAQVALLLTQDHAGNTKPRVDSQLLYRDGPPRVALPLQCEPESPWGELLSGASPSRPIQVVGQNSPEPVAAQLVSGPQAAELPQSTRVAAPQTAESLRAQISNPSWLCFVAPLILLALAISALVYRSKMGVRST
jgi:hypothetical protein